MSDFKKDVMDLVGKAKGVTADDAALPQIGGKKSKKHGSKKSSKKGSKSGSKKGSKKMKGGNPFIAASGKIRNHLKRMGITGAVPVVKTINHFLKKKDGQDWSDAADEAIKAIDKAGKDEVIKIFKRFGGNI